MKIFSSVLNFIFPAECHVCGEKLGPAERYICPFCLSKMPRTLYHRMKDNPMERRFMGQFPFRAATGHFFYSRGSEISQLIQDMKYRGFKGLGRHLGSIVAAELLPTGFLSEIDVIVPVPMHFYKKARRGFNQTEEIALGIKDVTSVPISLNLRAGKGHKTQTSLTLDQRRVNLEGVFKVKNPGELSGKRVLLVDDVCTTGATLSSAACCLVSDVQGIELSLLSIGVTF